MASCICIDYGYIFTNEIMKKSEVYTLLEKHYRTNYEQFINRYRRFLRSIHRAEDVVQEAYTRAFKYWESFPEDGNLDRWFGTILINVTKDYHRTEAMSGMCDNIDFMEIPVQSSGLPRVVYAQILERINSKEEPARTILDLYLVKQYRALEVADVLPETPAAIRQIVHRFREEIKRDFQWTL